jgi:hypothetical protein
VSNRETGRCGNSDRSPKKDRQSKSTSECNPSQANTQGRNVFARRITISEFSTRQIHDRGSGTKLSISHFLDPEIVVGRRGGCAAKWTSPQAGLTEVELGLLAVLYYVPFRLVEVRNRAARLKSQCLMPSFADIRWDNLIRFWEEHSHLSQPAVERRCYRHIKRLAEREKAQRSPLFECRRRAAA